MSMVLIDLPNFYNGLIVESSFEPLLTKAYFMYWLDLGLLASAINPDPKSSMGTWIYYSDRMMGRAAARISREELIEFTKRHNRLSGTSAIDVGIPGKQGESFKFTCSKCGEINATQSQSEKGIDSSLITHLFDTMDHWKTATIVSQDADYAPAVNALRKRGKLVYGAGFIDRAAESLITECFGYKDVKGGYIERDMCLFLLFQKGGSLSTFIKTADNIKGIRTSSYLQRLNWPRGETGGRWELNARYSTEKMTPDQESLLLDQAREIQQHFLGTVDVRPKFSPEIFIQMEIGLSPIELKSLYRAKDRYLDFEIREYEDVY